MMEESAKLVSLGMPTQLALEVARQIADGANAPNLVRLGVPTQLAIELAWQIANGADVENLASLGMPTQLAVEVARQIGGGEVIPPELPASVVSYYPVNEGSGTTLTDIVGGKTADLTSGGGTVGWTAEGWLQLTAGWFKTPSQATRTVVVMFRCPEGYTNYNFAAPNNDSIGQGYSGSSAATVRTLHGWGVSQIPRRTTGISPADNLAGGWCMASLQMAAQTTNVTAIGAATITGSGIVSSMEVAAIAIFATTVTDEELAQLADYAGFVNKTRGIYLRPKDCPTPAHLALVIGESTSEGTALLTSLSAPQRAATDAKVFIEARNTASTALTGRTMQVLSLAAGTANANAPSSITKSGLEVGILNARIANQRDPRRLDILKLAQGSSYLVPAATYTNAAGGSTIVVSQGSRNVIELANSGQLWMLVLRNLRRMENISRNTGIGYTTVSVIYNEGLNDAFIGILAVPDAATYQGYIQGLYDALEVNSGISNLKMIAIKPHEPLGGLGAGDPDYPNTSVGTNRLTALGYIRAAFDAFDAANSDVTLFDGNTFPLDNPTDYIHPSVAGYNAMGQAAEAAFAYNVIAEDFA